MDAFAVKNKTNGFTLAEVLITLGIIAVVAALTIPNITSHYRKTVVETRLARFYSVINQAIVRSEVDHGDKKYWDTLSPGYEEDEEGNTDYIKPKMYEWFNKYLTPYLSGITIKKDLKNDEGKIAVYFPDGSVVLASTASWLYFPEAKDFEKTENDNGTTNMNRSYGGTKMFTFQFYPSRGRGVEPIYYYLKDVDTGSGIQACTQYMPTGGERAYCTMVIQRNGWKIPKDYPLKF